MRDDNTERAEGYPGPLDLPDGHGAPDTDEPEARQFSLTDDVLALFEDGKTYAEAELRFQKSRAGFVGNRVKSALIYIFAAFGMFHLALIAATVGLVLALIPITGPLGATLIVTISLVVIGLIMLRLLKGRIDDIRDAFEGDDE